MFLRISTFLLNLGFFSQDIARLAHYVSRLSRLIHLVSFGGLFDAILVASPEGIEILNSIMDKLPSLQYVKMADPGVPQISTVCFKLGREGNGDVKCVPETRMTNLDPIGRPLHMLGLRTPLFDLGMAQNRS